MYEDEDIDFEPVFCFKPLAGMSEEFKRRYLVNTFDTPANTFHEGWVLA